MTEERAYALARRIAQTPGYRVLEVRRAWSAAVAWQVEAADRHTGEHLLLLSEDQFDSRLAAQSPTPPTAPLITAQTTERAAARSH